MPDERNIAHDKKVLEEKKKGETLEIEGEHPEHAPQPGRKTPQEHEDKNAIDESGNLIHEESENEDEKETFKI